MTADLHTLHPKQERRLMCPNCTGTEFRLLEEGSAECVKCKSKHPFLVWHLNVPKIS